MLLQTARVDGTVVCIWAGLGLQRQQRQYSRCKDTSSQRNFPQSLPGRSKLDIPRRTSTHVDACYANRLPKQPHKGRQRVCISGMGSNSFTKAAAAVQQAWQILSDEAPRGSLVPWTPRRGRAALEMEFSNRYFCLNNELPITDQIPLDDIIDPFSVLRNLCPANYRSEDNDVQYFERRSNPSEYVTRAA